MLPARLSLILALIFIAIGAIGVIESGFDKAKTGLIVGVVFALGMMIPFFMGKKGKPAANKVATILSVIFAIAIAGRFAPASTCAGRDHTSPQYLLMPSVSFLASCLASSAHCAP